MPNGIAERVRALQESAQLTQDDIGRVVGTSARTVARWHHGDCAPQREARQRLLELVYVAEQAVGVIQSADVPLWLFAPNRLLDHDSPADRIASGDYRTVIALVDALAEGITV
ncbi:helix-turn-helix domain-containing protein [Candidatus Poriferisodalis sp.]|uniref:helix-turn-helix domain-containing protein n=1 Tax=Candidatus Poriferisodalis sp. TaxID=3101277 RepID=UPI003B016C50